MLRRGFLGGMVACIATPCLAQLMTTGAGKGAPSGGGGFSPEASALFARMSPAPDDTRKALINTLIVDLKAGGVWAKLDALWVLAAHSADPALLNWVSTSFNASLVSTPSFTIDRGYTNNGSTAYLDTGYIPASAAGLLVQNSAHLSCWSRTAGQSGDGLIELGTTTTNGLDVGLRTSGDALVVRVNSTGVNTATVGSTDGSGHFVANRALSTTAQIFRNGAQFGADLARNSAGLSAAPVLIGGQNANISREWASASVGAALTSGEIAAFYTALNDYMVAVGAA